MSRKSAPRRHRWRWVALKLAILAILIWALRESLTTAFSDLAKHEWQVEPLWLVLAGVLYACGMALWAWFWRGILQSAGQHPASLPAMRAYFISQLGKYVPGKAMVVVLRTGLMRGRHVESTVVASSTFLETLTVMAVGSFLALVTLVCSRPLQLNAIAAATVTLLVTGLPTIPPVFKWITRVLRIERFNPKVLERLAGLNYRVMAMGWLFVALGWMIHGISLWATLRALGAPVGNPLEQLPLLTAAVALSVTLGFVVLLMPGGLGIREAILTSLMAPQFGPETALVAAVMLRLVWLVTELVVSGVLYLTGLRPRAASDRADPPPSKTAVTTPSVSSSET